MERNLNGKTILFLDGSAGNICVIEKAKELGARTVVANIFSDQTQPAKQVADRSCCVNFWDADAIKQLVTEEHVDGIFTTASDSHLRAYSLICEANGFYAYATSEQIEDISNKIRFKELCSKYGLKVIPEYTVHDSNDISELSIQYPVMVKSPDNSGGSKGMTLVYEESALPAAIELAKEYSPTKSVVIEHFIDGDEFVINYMFVDGEPFVLYTKDYCKAIQDGQVLRDNAMISPSKFEMLFYEKADKKLREMFKGIGMQNGIIFLQCFVEDDELYFFEGGCRAGGADEYFLWEDIYGVDFIKCLLRFAVFGSYNEPNLKEILSTAKQDRVESVLNILLNPGTIVEIKGADEVAKMPEVLTSYVNVVPGERIQEEFTSGQIGMRVMVSANNKEDYIRVIDKIYQTLQFVSEDGSNMLKPRIRFEHWLFDEPMVN
ncbi:MAG TPA: ATP-grasp domain-containing protein [Clostridiaceae bacterium]|jgi:biotin carboxylase|nr:ATP-grasp domain-containing protein [Clostridiaceae bacterium]